MNFKLCFVVWVALWGCTSANQESENGVKVLEKKLEEQEMRFASALEKLTDMILSIDDKLERNTQMLEKKSREQDMRITLAIDTISSALENTKNTKIRVSTTPELYSTHNAHGCESDNIQLSCPDNRTIFITKADFGEYTKTCDVDCCSPHPFDCTELMSDNDADQWLYIKLLCDNETDCSYPFQGSTFLNECTPTNEVDYVSVYYACEPAPTDEAVGFTAYATTSRSYNVDDIVIFDGIVSNFGNNYDESSSIYLCPKDGVYAFGISISTGVEDNMNVRLMKESVDVVGLQIDPIATSNYRNTGATLTVSECLAGERVWIRSAADNTSMDGDTSRKCVFYGFLLYSY